MATYLLGPATIWTRPLSRISTARVSESDGKKYITLSDSVGPLEVSRNSAEQAAKAINDFQWNFSIRTLSLPLPQADNHLAGIGAGGLFLLFGLLCVIQAFQTQTATFDKPAGEITLQSRGLLDTRTRIYMLGDVVAVENGTSRRTRQVIQVWNISGKPITLGTTDNPEILGRIRQFLKLPPG